VGRAGEGERGRLEDAYLEMMPLGVDEDLQ
jgi:hypothetical protein